MASNEAFLLLMGDFDYDELTGESPMTAGLWFWTFIFLLCQILLNMLMAIIMDMYTEVKGEVEGSDPIWSQAYQIYKDTLSIMQGESVSNAEMLRVLNDMPEEEVDEETLIKRVGPGLGEKQAKELIDLVRTAVNERLANSVNMTEAMRMIGWVKLKVTKIDTKLEWILGEEEKEKETMRRLSEGGDVSDLLGEQTASAQASALIAESAPKIDSVERRLGDLELLLQESMDFSSARGKDLKNRMQVIEELLRGSRETLVRSSNDVWDQKPTSPLVDDRDEI